MSHSGLCCTGFNVVCCCAGERVAGKLSLRIQQLDVMCAPAHPASWTAKFICVASASASFLVLPCPPMTCPLLHWCRATVSDGSRVTARGRCRALVAFKVVDPVNDRCSGAAHRCDTKTKDNVFVQIVVSVQYQVRSLRTQHAGMAVHTVSTGTRCSPLCMRSCIAICSAALITQPHLLAFTAPSMSRWRNHP